MDRLHALALAALVSLAGTNLANNPVDFFESSGPTKAQSHKYFATIQLPGIEVPNKNIISATRRRAIAIAYPIANFGDRRAE